MDDPNYSDGYNLGFSEGSEEGFQRGYDQASIDQYNAFQKVLKAQTQHWRDALHEFEINLKLAAGIK